jgi:hypothetical protein
MAIGKHTHGPKLLVVATTAAMPPNKSPTNKVRDAAVISSQLRHSGQAIRDGVHSFDGTRDRSSDRRNRVVPHFGHDAFKCKLTPEFSGRPPAL